MSRKVNKNTDPISSSIISLLSKTFPNREYGPCHEMNCMVSISCENEGDVKNNVSNLIQKLSLVNANTKVVIENSELTVFYITKTKDIEKLVIDHYGDHVKSVIKNNPIYLT